MLQFGSLLVSSFVKLISEPSELLCMSCSEWNLALGSFPVQYQGQEIYVYSTFVTNLNLYRVIQRRFIVDCGTEFDRVKHKVTTMCDKEFIAGERV